MDTLNVSFEDFFKSQPNPDRSIADELIVYDPKQRFQLCKKKIFLYYFKKNYFVFKFIIPLHSVFSSKKI